MKFSTAAAGHGDTLSNQLQYRDYRLGSSRPHITYKCCSHFLVPRMMQLRFLCGILSQPAHGERTEFPKWLRGTHFNGNANCWQIQWKKLCWSIPQNTIISHQFEPLFSPETTISANSNVVPFVWGLSSMRFRMNCVEPSRNGPQNHGLFPPHRPRYEAICAKTITQTYVPGVLKPKRPTKKTMVSLRFEVDSL